ncbi:unnamed protein product [Effrenium voratum]|uniref:Uncharacterized protein n=1 Tax=Effrenium voratum TaxID=2562239 RepID=A0AA36IIC7_9DINO|nr:unnamed protein product [Effrenium voratum]CAJ1423625.1 unnamed protein product [Effrenium voratum]
MLRLLVCALLPVAGELRLTGQTSCPCLDFAEPLGKHLVNTQTHERPSRLFGEERLGHGSKVDCLMVSHVDPLLHPNETICYPTDYGQQRCEAWDQRLPLLCAYGRSDQELPDQCKGLLMARKEGRCEGIFSPKAFALPWCQQSWCYVDESCDLQKSKSYFFPDTNLWYSYETCTSRNFFEIWNMVQLEMCSRFSVVEKPYIIMWLSCWTCAFLQQVIDTTRKLEEQQDRLGKWQRAYLGIQLLVLVTETYANMQRIPWGQRDFWSCYNLYVYVFINSAVFVRATMMSQVVWDWYEVRLLKLPVLPFQMDGKGWTDEMRAGLLVCIFQFLSSLGVFFVISVTHLVPALVLYPWIFWVVAAGLVKSRLWIGSLGFDPESRFGRALVVGTNSFMSVMGIQVLVTCMVRTYAGEWSNGYLGPLWNDLLVRRLQVWYTCHLRHATVKQMMMDQDFINLFVR